MEIRPVMPFNKKTYERNQRKLEKLFTLKGAKCLGIVYAEGDEIHSEGFLFKKGKLILFLNTAGYSLGVINKKTKVLFKKDKTQGVFSKIFGNDFFEEIGDGRWMKHTD